jgi:hypothetical protein
MADCQPQSHAAPPTAARSGCTNGECGGEGGCAGVASCAGGEACGSFGGTGGKNGQSGGRAGGGGEGGGGEGGGEGRGGEGGGGLGGGEGGGGEGGGGEGVGGCEGVGGREGGGGEGEGGGGEGSGGSGEGGGGGAGGKAGGRGGLGGGEGSGLLGEGGGGGWGSGGGGGEGSGGGAVGNEGSSGGGGAMGGSGGSGGARSWHHSNGGSGAAGGSALRVGTPQVLGYAPPGQSAARSLALRAKRSAKTAPSALGKSEMAISWKRTPAAYTSDGCAALAISVRSAVSVASWAITSRWADATAMPRESTSRSRIAAPRQYVAVTRGAGKLGTPVPPRCMRGASCAYERPSSAALWRGGTRPKRSCSHSAAKLHAWYAWTAAASERMDVAPLA